MTEEAGHNCSSTRPESGSYMLPPSRSRGGMNSEASGFGPPSKPGFVPPAPTEVQLVAMRKNAGAISGRRAYGIARDGYLMRNRRPSPFEVTRLSEHIGCAPRRNDDERPPL